MNGRTWLVAPLLLLLVHGAWSAEPQSTSAAPEPGRVPTSVPNVFYIPSTPGFDPTTASNQELIAHGYPPRPDRNTDPAGFDVWHRAISARRIMPDFKPGRKVEAPLTRLQPATGQGTSWSGVVVTGTGLNTMSGVWSVPTVHAPANTCSSPGGYWSSTWVGFDGIGNNLTGLFQAGTDQFVCSNGSLVPSYTVWALWYPGPFTTALNNFPIAPGDAFYFSVSQVNATTGQVVVTNLTQEQGTSFQMTAPMGYTWGGTSAEWIFERPATGCPNCVPDPLPAFGAESFWTMRLQNAQSPGDFGASTQTEDMVDANNMPLTQTIVLSKDAALILSRVH
jgi:hypothetical protein